MTAPMRERSTCTEPPPKIVFSDDTTQWGIYDAYMEDADKKRREAERKEKAKNPFGGAGGDKKKKVDAEEKGDDPFYSSSMSPL